MRTLRGMAYRNLHQEGVVYSFRHAASGLVVMHGDRFVLKDVTFTVQPSGRDRVRETGSKVVHAGVTGTLVTDPCEMARLYAKLRSSGRTAYYNPFKTDRFVDESGNELESASCALVTSRDGRSLVKIA